MDTVETKSVGITNHQGYEASYVDGNGIRHWYKYEWNHEANKFEVVDSGQEEVGKHD